MSVDQHFQKFVIDRFLKQDFEAVSVIFGSQFKR